MEYYSNYLKRIFAISQLDIDLIDDSGETICSLHRFYKNKDHMAFYQQARLQFISLLSENIEQDTMPILITLQGLSFCGAKLLLAQGLYYLIVGPFLIGNNKNLSTDWELKRYSIEEVNSFLPLFFEDTGSLVIQGIQNNLTTVPGADLEYFLNDEDRKTMLKNAKMEKTIRNAIQKGDLDQLKKIETEQGVLFSYPRSIDIENDLERQREMSRIANTMGMRAAEDGGVPSEITRPVGTMNLRKLYELNTIEDFFVFRRIISRQYCEMVNKYKMSSYSHVVRHAITYMTSHLDSDISLSLLAEVCNVSYSYLSRCIKNECGCSFSTLAHQLRISRAKEILNAGSSISEAAYQVGYKTASQFSRAFKSIEGLTPSEWLNKL